MLVGNSYSLRTCDIKWVGSQVKQSLSLESIKLNIRVGLVWEPVGRCQRQLDVDEMKEFPRSSTLLFHTNLKSMVRENERNVF